MSETQDDGDIHATGDPQNVLESGADIEFTDDRPTHCADRIEFLNGGWVKAIYKNNYQMEVYPPDAIEGIYTHTNDVEDEEWW